jgi:hypothetical protein
VQDRDRRRRAAKEALVLLGQWSHVRGEKEKYDEKGEEGGAYVLIIRSNIPNTNDNHQHHSS